MRPTRRSLLLSAGTGFLLLARDGRGQVLRSVPLAAPLADPTLPWSAAPAAAGHPDPRIRALAWAVLAPNPHNRQPWIAELPGGDPGLVILRCDLDRRLPETDPFDRQVTIGLGAFAELFRLAAAAQGRAATVTPMPEGEAMPRLDARPVAALRLGPPGSAEPDPLFAHAPARRSFKRPFDTSRPVAPAALEALRAVAPGTAFATAEPGAVQALRDLAWRGLEAEGLTPSAWMESVNLMRIGPAEIAASPDGIALPALPGLTREALADTAGPAFRQMGEQYRAVIGSAMAWVWLVTPGNGRAAQLGAGRDWLRLNLMATALGLGCHPLSQVLQEFPAMAPLHEEAHRRLAPSGGTVQMLGRLGHAAAAAPPTPRWPLESRLRAT